MPHDVVEQLPPALKNQRRGGGTCVVGNLPPFSACKQYSKSSDNKWNEINGILDPETRRPTLVSS